MIHHLLPGRVEHHIPAMIRYFTRIHERLCTPGGEPVFVFYGASAAQLEKYRTLVPEGWRAIDIDKGRLPLFRYIWNFDAADALILHSAFYPWLWFFLLARPRLWPRVAWIMWGADIYGRDSLRGRIYRRVKGIVVKRLAGVSALVPGDFDDLQRLIGPCRNYVRAFYSPDYGEVIERAPSDGTTRIILGNSGWEQSNHIPALEWLGRFRDKPIEVVCPLGYPPESAYKTEVIEAGRRILGERFRPIAGMLDWDAYHALLATCDVLVLNNTTQQGLGNLYYMLRAGAKVYVRGDSATFRMLAEMGFKINDTRDIERIPFEELIANSGEVADLNRRCFEQHLSTEASIGNWLALMKKISVARLAA
ncbi:TDP-N-acetylfucosamine:lipid II N-acetylfucosaminyltransferase [bacterium]|nr:TDP-N-acetylfucosamine:lipid II N-acetylfucosaminyltransferase [bacterium]